MGARETRSENKGRATSKAVNIVVIILAVVCCLLLIGALFLAALLLVVASFIPKDLERWAELDKK